MKLPDLILVDGGITQLNAALRALKVLELSIPCAGMVKDKRHRTRGLILMNGTEVDLKKNQQVMKLISEIQEEVHRFTIDYHKKLRKKQTITSILDEIRGIGNVRKRELFKQFGSIDEIKKASLEELIEVKSMNKKSAEKIYSYFH
jgi:excinuclease ABC subunit C